MLEKLKSHTLLVRPGFKAKISSRPTRVKDLYETDSDYKSLLADLVDELSDEHDKLYAENRQSLLIIFQGMDTSGKDSAIKHVMSGLNPQGVSVASFFKPSEEENDHDFLWRTHSKLPARGMIGIFNRSYYEEVVTVRVHPEFLERQRLPKDRANLRTIWKERFEDIRNHELYLSRQGMRIVKFFLHISRDEQRERLLARIDNPDKNWKFDTNDVEERKHWTSYMKAFEDCLSETSTKHAPWYAIPADDKKNARLMISQIILEHMKEMCPKYPEATPEHRRELQKIRKELVK